MDTIGGCHDHISRPSHGECGQDGEVVIRASVASKRGTSEGRRAWVEWLYPVVESSAPVHRVHDMDGLCPGKLCHLLRIDAVNLSTNGELADRRSCSISQLEKGFPNQLTYCWLARHGLKEVLLEVRACLRQREFDR